MVNTLHRYRGELIHDGKRYFPAYCVLALEPLLLVPLLLGLLSGEQLGMLGAVEALNVVLCGISQLGVKFAYLQFVADHGQNGRGRGFWTATLLTAVAGLFAGGIFALLLNSAWVAFHLGVSPEIHWLTLGALLLATNVQMMLVTDLRAKRSPRPFVFASGIRVLLMLALLAWLAPSSASPVNGVLLAQALASGVSILVLCLIGGIPRVTGFDPKLAREFVGYGWPIATGSLIKYGTDALLPWLCLALVSPVSAGAMALAAKTAAMFDAGFGLPFLMAWGGRIYEWLKEQASRAVLPRLFAGIALAAAVAALLSWGVGEWLLWLSGSEREVAVQAMVLLPFALAGKALFVLRSPASAGLLITRDMRWNIGYAVKALVAFAFLGPLMFRFFGAPGGWGVFVVIEAAVVTHMFLRGNALLHHALAPADAGPGVPAACRPCSAVAR